jgi:hypothetical protein
MNIINREGYNQLWAWFGLSYSSFLTLPRSMMHEMPDEWQMKMAELLEEWNDHWDFSSVDLEPSVSFKRNGKYASPPKWVCNYRHPDINEINKLKKAYQK